MTNYIYVYMYISIRNFFLQELEKGKYAHTDVYIYHTFINKDVLLLTDKRLSYLEHNDLFGGWRVSINCHISLVLNKNCDVYLRYFIIG